MRDQVGRMNLTKREAMAMAREILDDPAYKANFVKRAIEGTLSPQMEALVWHYAFGKPREYYYVGRAEAPETESLGGLSDDELAERAERIARSLRKRDDDDDPVT